MNRTFWAVCRIGVGLVVWAVVGLPFSTDRASLTGSATAAEAPSGVQVILGSLISDLPEYYRLLESSPMMLRDGGVVLDESELPREDLPELRRKLGIARTGLEHLRENDMSRTERVIVVEREDSNVVVFDLHLPPDTLGGGFAYALVLDKETGALIGSLVSD